MVHCATSMTIPGRQISRPGRVGCCYLQYASAPAIIALFNEIFRSGGAVAMVPHLKTMNKVQESALFYVHKSLNRNMA